MIYHKDVHLPRRVRGMVPTGVKSLTYSNHAKKEFADKYGQIVPPDSLNFGTAEVVEVTVFGTTIDKLVLRSSYDEKTDVIFVCIPCDNKKRWFVKTVWLNTKDDTHKTLDVNRFAVDKT